jgi:GT2 family glycosyltransferase
MRIPARAPLEDLPALHGPVAVVVPNFNGGPGLALRMRQLTAHPIVGPVVLVDDRSTDGFDPTGIAKEVVVLRNGGRRGFAATTNVGIAHLLAAGAPDFIAVANNDLVFDRNFGRAMEGGVAHLVDNPDVHCCGFEEVAEAPVDPGPPEGPVPVRAAQAVAGCLMLFRTEVFRRLGLISEGYFMYAEELDFFDRMRRHGLGLAHVGLPVVHEGEGARLPGLKTTWLAHRNEARRAFKSLDLRVVTRSIGSLVVMPFFRSPERVAAHPGLRRTHRYGRVAASALGVLALGWNLVHLPETFRERRDEDRRAGGQE